MAGKDSLFGTITGFFAPVHADGHKFVAIAALVTLAGFFLYSPLGWVGVVVTSYIAYFFRDPERVVPVRPGLIIAPADGKVSAIEDVMPPAELGLSGERRVRVSIFLSVFDVHINRMPVGGEIERMIYVKGLFINAAADKASEDNERNSLIIKSEAGDDIAVVQIAGLIARRIVPFVKANDRLGVGERFGLIRFGSRVDVYLPPGKQPLVAIGQRAVGGETVIADLRSDEPVRDYKAI